MYPKNFNQNDNNCYSKDIYNKYEHHFNSGDICHNRYVYNHNSHENNNVINPYPIYHS